MNKTSEIQAFISNGIKNVQTNKKRMSKNEQE